MTEEGNAVEKAPWTIESCPFAMVVVGPDFRIVDANEKMARSSGYARQELVGSPLPDHFRLPASEADAIGDLLVEGRTSGVALLLRTRTGEERPVWCAASTFRDRDGSPRVAIATSLR